MCVWFPAKGKKTYCSVYFCQPLGPSNWSTEPLNYSVINRRHLLEKNWEILPPHINFEVCKEREIGEIY